MLTANYSLDVRGLSGLLAHVNMKHALYILAQ
jgi:hypothetical protein